MEIDRLLGKLKPLKPKLVDHWRRVRDTADPELRSLLDKEIVSTAYRELGDFRSKPLLSLPGKRTAHGDLNLGTIIYESQKWPLGISTGELLRNLAIFGMSGAGKTNLTFHLLKQLEARRIPFLYLDWKRTARHLLPHLKRPARVATPGRALSPFSFNPFTVPPGLEARVYVGQVVDVMASAYTLGDGARNLMQKALTACLSQKPNPNATDILAELEKTPGKGRVAGWKETAARALESQEFANLFGSGEKQQYELANTLLNRSTILELDALSQNAKAFLIPMLCLWLYHAQLAQDEREQLKLVIFVEEAHHVLHRRGANSGETVMEMLLRQCREIGIAMVVVDQHPHLISSAALGNTYTSVCLNLKDPSDITKAAQLSLLDDCERRFLSMLPVGRAVVKLQDRWRMPVLIQIPQVRVAKGAVTDKALHAFLSENLTLSGLKRAVPDDPGTLAESRGEDGPLSRDEEHFVQDVLAHPDDGVNARYTRLRMSADKGNRIKNALLQRQILRAEEVPIARTRRILLGLTSLGRRQLGLKPQDARIERASLAHEHWKRYYARYFESLGYHVELEAPRVGGRVDVLATRDKETIGIEIETGKSDYESNLKNCLKSGFDRVIVVATSREATERIGPAICDVHPSRRVALRSSALQLSDLPEKVFR